MVPGSDGYGAEKLTLPFMVPWLSTPRWGLLIPCPFLTGKVQGLADSPFSSEGNLSDLIETEAKASHRVCPLCLGTWAVGMWTGIGGYLHLP